MTNDLNRFIKAQETAYQTALGEITNGKKRSHWMWYIFPQLEGLGMSETARFYGIKNKAEAVAYLEHPVLGKRLLEISNVLLTLDSADAHAILGSPDDVKLKSSMTLFAALDTSDVFQAVLEKFYGGSKDEKTLQLLQGS
ncbi:DUF1810 domain-containing protein [Segetibacter sp. 3557_3]|uniref:DUF1810 domain-containing protein n=1 Tax=Segetibacter sp. 3557_3 TaxID=2547429 RepID=UPI001058AC6B|nr:DUF1810 domain-containing protein [Segetibacter sp. 3557_3]TDH18373.1 DUF1810 domain-containing protein [Segetibacter sp. 3557_3]